MDKSEYNLRLIREIEENRRFLLTMYQQNPGLLKHADKRIPPLLKPLVAENKAHPVKQRGISLIELIVFIVIVSTAMAGILLVMNQVTQHSADPLIRKQALAVAESMLEEIRLQPLNPAGCSGALGQNAARTGASCVGDYSGYSTSGGIRDFSTNGQVPGLGGYEITGVVVTPVANLGGTAINPAVGFAFVITVTVAYPGMDPVTVTGYRAG